MWAVGFSAQCTSRGHREEGKLDVKYEENLDGKRKEKAQERKEKAQKTEESLFGKFGLLVTTSSLMWGYPNRGCPSFGGWSVGLISYNSFRRSIRTFRRGGRGRSIVPHSKCGVPQGTVGSNPTLSAICLRIKGLRDMVTGPCSCSGWNRTCEKVPH